MEKQYRKLKLACYTSNVSMSVVGNLPPLLFLTFREMYGISYTLLAMLVVINFVTQLIIDLIFSFFSHKFNIRLMVRLMPVLTVIGLLLYSLAPVIFPDTVYLGLCIGTVVFSAAAGLGEVLISPVIAALPSPDPDREMAKLHSVYAWGVVGIVPVATLFIFFCGGARWQLLVLIFILIPLVSAILFATGDIPDIGGERTTVGVLKQFKNKKLWISVLCIFLGGAAECTMAQWSSGYIENALGLPKLWGDLFGVALFGAMLGLGRTLYSKLGKNIGRVLFMCALGAAVCYIVCALSPVPVIGLIFCALCGLCVSMLWPGSLVAATEMVPQGGVLLFAMMAAGGDLGASVGPSIVGRVTDAVIESEKGISLASTLGLLPDQLGMKVGILAASVFALLAVPLYLAVWRNLKKGDRE